MRIAASLITALVLSISTLSLVGCATSGDEYEALDGEARLAGKLAFWQSTDGQWRFNLKSGNGAILLTSEAYTSRTGAINGALSVLENGVDKAMYQVASAEHGFIVHLLAANHEIISTSEVYATKSSATRAIASCVNAVLSYLDRREAQSAGARLEVLAGDSGKFRFNFHAKNGEIVLSSEHYDSEAAAINGAFAAQAASRDAAAYTLRQNAEGKFFVTLATANGEIVGITQLYTTKQSAQGAIAAMQKLLPTITVL